MSEFQEAAQNPTTAVSSVPPAQGHNPSQYPATQLPADDKHTFPQFLDDDYELPFGELGNIEGDGAANEDTPIEINDAAQTLRNFGPTYTAHLFNENGEQVGQGLRVRFSVSCDHHMPEMKIYACLPPPLRLKKKAKEDQVGQENQEGQEQPVEDQPEYLPGDPAVTQKVFVYINYQALQSGRVVAFDKASRLRMSAEHKKLYFDDISTDLMRVINELDELHKPDELDNVDDATEYTVRLDVVMNPLMAACEKVWGGTPAWGQGIADLIKTGRFTLLIEGLAATQYQIRCLSSIMDMCKGNHPYNPLYVWHKGRRRLVFTEKFTHSEPCFPPGFPKVALAEFKYATRFAYHTFDEYATVTFIGAMLENKLLRKNTDLYEQDCQILKLMPLPGGGDRTFVGFLSAPKSGLRLSERTSIKIYFGSAKVEDVERPAWSATVASMKLSFGPSEDISVYVRRHWDKKTEEYDPFQPILTRNVQEALLLDAAELIEEEQGNQVRVQIINHDKSYKRKMEAIETLSTAPSDLPFTQWNTDMRGLLPSYQGDRHAVRDIFKRVRQSNPEFEKDLDLYLEQLELIKIARQTPAGVSLLYGPPGTGKTHCQVQAASAFFRIKEDVETVLALAPTNGGVDLLAEKLDEHLKKQQGTTDSKVSKQRYVVRLHPLATENAINKADANIQRLARNPPSRPQDFEAIDFKGLAEASQVAKEAYDADHEKKFLGISDPRVQCKDLSVGSRMQQIAGVPGYECSITHPDSSKFQAFREQMNLYRNSHEMDKDQKEYFEAVCKDMYNYVIGNASAVVATPAAASLPRNLDTLTRTTAIILVDEFARVRDDELIPFLNARMSKCSGLIGFGDTQQLQPTVTSEPDTNPYASALVLSWMFRLIQQGFPYALLTEQSRMVPEISALINELAYNNLVKDKPSTKFERRGYAAGFSKAIEEPGKKKKQSVLFLDILEGDAVVVETTSKNSRYCEYYVKIIINSLEDLLRKFNNTRYRGATIAIMTAYKAQLALHQKALDAMIRAGVPGAERVRLLTVDAAQGYEYDVVLMDILIADTAGFMTDVRRLNVMLSRARNGMIIVGSSAHLRNSGGNFKQKRHLRKLFDLLKAYRRKVENTHDTVKCKYYEDKDTTKSNIGGFDSITDMIESVRDER